MRSELIDKFIAQLRDSYSNEALIKVTISGKLDPEIPYSKLTAKLVEVRGKLLIQFVYKYDDKVITKNHDLEESCKIIAEELNDRFANITLMDKTNIYQYNKQNKKIDRVVNKSQAAVNKVNDKTKQRLISAEKPYLHLLGITTKEGAVKAEKQKKYKQINKYIELMAPRIAALDLGNNYKVMDMGSGKGYLTFALYDYLTNSLGHEPTIVGVELREELVSICNSYSQKAGMKGLSFENGYISNVEDFESEVLIALHACDTATDDAISAGIKSKSKLIVCSPCCHKQIRKQMKVSGNFESVTRFGILKERQAEIITDTIRAMILEYFGYKTMIMEFISTEHTPKNLLITAVKNSVSVDKEGILRKISELKKEFGIEYHYLEKVTGLIKD